MADGYRVGYGKPPRGYQFKPGNQAARKRKSGGKNNGKGKALILPEIIDRALRTRRKIKRGGEVYSLPVAEILVERLVHTMTTGSPRDLALMVQLLEKHLPDALSSTPEALEVVYHRARGSQVALPDDELFAEAGS